MAKQFCPCGNSIEFEHCCAPYLSGQSLPANAEQLMRSRYSAYAHRNTAYLVETWHPSTRHPQLAELIDQGQDECQWLSLRVVDRPTSNKEDQQFVRFFARYLAADQRNWIYETSRFLREENRWYYVDGIHQVPNRNQVCPCGSNKKFKKCCAN